jgi:hypothetical protein
MGIKTKLGLLIAKRAARKVTKWSSTAVRTQDKILLKLVKQAAETGFGKTIIFQPLKITKISKRMFPLEIMKT